MPGKSKAQIAKENRDRNKKVNSSTNSQARVGKSKAQFVKKQKEKNLEKRKRANMKKSVDRPQQKQKPKKKSILKKIHDKLFTRSTAPWSKGKAAKAAEIKRKEWKPFADDKKASVSDRQPGIKKANERKESSRDYVKRHAGVTGKMPKAKDSQLMKAEAARRKRAKSKKAKQDSAAIMKAERANRAKSKKSIADKKAADNRDAKRGGFISANAMKSSAKKANKTQADRKKRKSDELISRGRR